MLDFPGRDVLFVLFLATMLVPLEATLVVNRRTVDSLGWLNTYQGLAVPFLATAFGTFLVRQAFLGAAEGTARRGPHRRRRPSRLPAPRRVADRACRRSARWLCSSFLSTWNQYLWPNLITTEAT